MCLSGFFFLPPQNVSFLYFSCAPEFSQIWGTLVFGPSFPTAWGYLSIFFIGVYLPTYFSVCPTDPLSAWSQEKMDTYLQELTVVPSTDQDEERWVWRCRPPYPLLGSPEISYMVCRTKYEGRKKFGGGGGISGGDKFDWKIFYKESYEVMFIF